MPMPPKIPFHKPWMTGKEIEYIARAIATGAIAGDGPYTRACGRLLEGWGGIPKVMLTPSCTAALEMAAMLCELAPGDEVILPSFTFVTTASAFVRSGARPVFVDIRPDTLNLDEALIEGAITPRTRAIVPVHYAGVACEMDRIMAIARRRRLVVIEDAAQGVGASYRGKALGSIGDLGTYSFHETKNVTCGEGGAICINAGRLVERAEILREKGTDRLQFLRGQVDKYSWVDVGSSYLPSEICSAFLMAQLERLADITARRRAIHDCYAHLLAPLASEGRLRLPSAPEECVGNHHLFYILLPDAAIRDALLAHLREGGIQASFHYVPLHTSPMGRRFGYRPGDLPVTEDLSGRLLRLPMFHDITDAEQMRVVEQVRSFLMCPAT